MTTIFKRHVSLSLHLTPMLNGYKPHKPHKLSLDVFIDHDGFNCIWKYNIVCVSATYPD